MKIDWCFFIGHSVEPVFHRAFCYRCHRCNEEWQGYEELKELVGFNQEKHRRLFFVTLVLLLLTLATTCHSAITPEFLNKIQAIESSNNPLAVGDNGRSVGLFQFSRAAWADCSKIRQKQGLSVYPYSNATNAYIARLYAGTWFKHLESRLVASRQKPTRELLLACHQCGINGVKRRNYDLQKVPKSTRNAIAQLNK